MYSETKKNIENSEAASSTPTMYDPVRVRALKMSNGTSGAATRRSITTNAASSARLTAISPIVSAEPQPAPLALTSA